MECSYRKVQYWLPTVRWIFNGDEWRRERSWWENFWSRFAGMIQCSSDCQFVFENCHAVISILVISNQCSYVIFLHNICSRVYIKIMRDFHRKNAISVFLSFSSFPLALSICIIWWYHYSWHKTKNINSQQCQKLRSYKTKISLK